MKKTKNKKRKFKKSFKCFLFFIVLVLITIPLYFIIKNKILPLIKNRSNNIQVDNTNQDESKNDTQSKLISLFSSRIASLNIGFIYASSSDIMQDQSQKIFMTSTSGSTYIYVNTLDNADYVWNTFQSAVSNDPLKSLLKNNAKNLEYIDLRFKNKVFYKFTNGDNNNLNQNHSTSSQTSSSTLIR